MSGGDLTEFQGGDLAHQDADGGPLVETGEDVRSSLEEIVADLTAEKVAGAPRRSLVKEKAARGDYDKRGQRLGIPAGVSHETRSAWANLPKEVRKDFAELGRKHAEASARWESVAGYGAIAERSGTTLAAALADYVGVEDALRSDFLSGLNLLCQRFGADPRAVVQAWGQTLAYPQFYGQRPMMAQTSAAPSFNATLAAMRADKLNFPFIDRLQGTMQQLLQAGRARSLEDAYRLAEGMLQPELREAAQRRREATAQARAAAKAIVGYPTPGVRASEGPDMGEMSTRDALRAAVDRQLMGGG